MGLFSPESLTIAMIGRHFPSLSRRPVGVSNERQQLEAAILALEAQRGVLGDAVVDASIGALREKLAAHAGPDANETAQALKQVTILFLDVVGSTALSQHLDPETISEVAHQPCNP